MVPVEKMALVDAIKKHGLACMGRTGVGPPTGGGRMVSDPSSILEKNQRERVNSWVGG